MRGMKLTAVSKKPCFTELLNPNMYLKYMYNYMHTYLVGAKSQALSTPNTYFSLSILL